MTKRERVEATMNFREVDRIPVYDLLFNDAAIEYYSGQKLETGDIKTVCKAVGNCLDMVRSMTAPANPGRRRGVNSDPRITPLKNNEIVPFIDNSPFEIEQQRWTSWYGKSSLNTMKDLVEWAEKDIERKNKWNPDSFYADAFRNKYLELQSMAGDAVIMLATSQVGIDFIFNRIGLESFSYFMFDYPDLLSAWLDAYTGAEIKRIHAIADYKLSPCALTYSDIAYKGNMIFSPDFIRKELIHRLKKINGAWHEHNIKCLFHSDGYLMDILPDLISADIDGLNPIETNAGMNLKEVKKLYGDKIFISGGIDVSQLMSLGTEEQVREACFQAIEDAGPTGYFLGSTTELHNSIPLNNIIELMNAPDHYNKIKLKLPSP